MSMTVTSIPNAYQNPTRPLDTNDPHQQPNLDFFDFRPKPREVWVQMLCKLYGRPGKDGMLSVFDASGKSPLQMHINRKDYEKQLERFVNFWIDRFIARAERVKKWYLSNDRSTVDPATLQFLEVMPDGMLRRGTLPTLVHVAEPDEGEGTEDLSDVAISQSQWENDPRFRADLRERQRLARKADLTIGQLEEMQRRLRSEGTQG